MDLMIVIDIAEDARHGALTLLRQHGRVDGDAHLRPECALAAVEARMSKALGGRGR